MTKIQWIDRDGVIWYANEKLKQGFDMNTAIHAALHQTAWPYCKNPQYITKPQLKRLMNDIQIYSSTGKYPSQISHF